MAQIGNTTDGSPAPFQAFVWMMMRHMVSRHHTGRDVVIPREYW